MEIEMEDEHVNICVLGCGLLVPTAILYLYFSRKVAAKKNIIVHQSAKKVNCTWTIQGVPILGASPLCFIYISPSDLRSNVTFLFFHLLY